MRKRNGRDSELGGEVWSVGGGGELWELEGKGGDKE